MINHVITSCSFKTEVIDENTVSDLDSEIGNSDWSDDIAMMVIKDINTLAIEAFDKNDEDDLAFILDRKMIIVENIKNLEFNDNDMQAFDAGDEDAKNENTVRTEFESIPWY